MNLRFQFPHRTFLSLMVAVSAMGAGCGDSLPPGPGAGDSGSYRLLFSHLVPGGYRDDSVVVAMVHPDGSGGSNILPGHILAPAGTNRFAFGRNDSIFVATWSGASWGIRHVTAAENDFGEINEGSVALSPDGRFITFTTEARNSSAGYRQLNTYVSVVDGSGAGMPLTVSSLGGAAPVFSRDSRRLAFYGVAGHRYYGSEKFQLFVYDLERGESRSVAEVNDIILEDLGPALDWSPDGTRIAYTDAGSDGDSVSSPLMVRIASSDGSAPPRTLASHAVFPVWSGDGRRVYYSGGGYDWHLMAANADGSGVPDTLAEPGGAREVFAQMSPDGKKLAYSVFTGDPEKNPGTVMVMDPADPSRTVVAGSNGHRALWLRLTR